MDRNQGSRNQSESIRNGCKTVMNETKTSDGSGGGGIASAAVSVRLRFAWPGHAVAVVANASCSRGEHTLTWTGVTPKSNTYIVDTNLTYYQSPTGIGAMRVLDVPTLRLGARGDDGGAAGDAAQVGAHLL
jgi:hypothetical protein